VWDKRLISSFVERWHEETNTFHLSIGEKTITLDDMSSLLHLPILGQFPTYVPLEYGGVVNVFMELLGVDEGHGKDEMRQCHGAHIQLSWLREVYQDCCILQSW